MHIQTVHMENWVCFSGENTVHLEPKAYAVVGARVDRDGSSNWTGKSSFVESIRFALYGEHRYRTEDEWITRGKPQGSVTLTFDDGMVITRARKRGKRTELTLVKGDVSLAQADAQAEIACIFGADLAAFNTTSFFEQRNMARLINASTEERMKAVSSWVDLSLLEAGEVALRAKYKAALSEVDSRRGVATHIELDLSRLGTDFMEEDERAALNAELETMKSYLESERMARVSYEHAISNLRRLKGELQQIKLQGELVSTELKASLVRRLPVVTGDIGELQNQTAVLKHEMERANAMRRDGFNGTCPVLKSACPSVEFVNSKAQDAASIAEQAAEAWFPVHQKWMEAVDTDRMHKDHSAHVNGLKDKLELLRKEYTAKADVIARHEATATVTPNEEMTSRIESANARVHEISLQLIKAKYSAKHAEDLKAHLAEAQAGMETAATEVRAIGVALDIVGKNGLQRVISERTMAKIAGDASLILQTAGIDLGLSISWAREGSGKASSCSACGTAFPASLKVVKCTTCGAERGANMIQKVEIILSDRSGAAEDLAGIALQLAAAKHMKESRGLGADFCILDEPFGALDAHNREGLSKSLPQVLASAGMRQSFIIAHSPDVMEFLPGRIEVLAGKEGSALKVAV